MLMFIDWSLVFSTGHWRFPLVTGDLHWPLPLPNNHTRSNEWHIKKGIGKGVMCPLV